RELRPDIFPNRSLANRWSIQVIEHICGCIFQSTSYLKWIARFYLDLDLTRVLERYIHSRFARVSKLIPIFLILKSYPGRLYCGDGWLTSCQHNDGKDKQNIKMFWSLFNLLLAFMFKCGTR